MAATQNAQRTIPRREATFLFAVVGLLLAVTSLSAGHPVSVTVTQVYVTPESASVKMQVFLEDLFLFHNLQPNDAEFLERDVLEAGMELHEQFILDRFSISDLAGQRLIGRVVAVDDSDVPSEGVPLSDLMAHQVTFELEYDFTVAPDFLSFSQRFTDDEGMLPSEMRLQVKQENAADATAVLLRPDDLETVRFDWNLPALSPEASEAERQAWAAKKQEEALGITSYGEVYSFLYIEEHEIRHEILIPLLTLEQSVLVARDADDFLDVPEQDAARQQIEAYFKSGNPIEVNGETLSGAVQRCDFYGLDFRDFALQTERKRVPISTARVGVILTYPTTDSPNTVQLTWNRFNPFAWSVNTVVFAFDETIKTTLSRLKDQHRYLWTGEARPPVQPPDPIEVERAIADDRSLPVLPLTLLGLGLLTAVVLAVRRTRPAVCFSAFVLFSLVALLWWAYAQGSRSAQAERQRQVTAEQTDAIFAALLQNLYRAFDYRGEEEIYDVLAVSTSGDFLHEVYLEMRGGLEMAEQGGAVARVKDVSIVSGHYETLSDKLKTAPDTFAYRCRWNVSGTVEHWGHIHQRTNQYEAVFDVKAIDGHWKVVGLQLHDERRLEFETRLRGL